MIRWTMVIALPFILFQTSPAFSAERPASAQEGARKLVEGLELLLQSVPQYDLPIVLENGDILIRRIHASQNDNGSSNEVGSNSR